AGAFPAAGEPRRQLAGAAASGGAAARVLATAAATTGARPSRRLHPGGDLFAGDTRVDLRDLGAAPLRLRAAHGRLSALWRGVAGAADAGRGGAPAGATPRRGAPGDVGGAALRAGLVMLSVAP